MGTLCCKKHGYANGSIPTYTLGAVLMPAASSTTCCSRAVLLVHLRSGSMRISWLAATLNTSLTRAVCPCTVARHAVLTCPAMTALWMLRCSPTADMSGTPETARLLPSFKNNQAACRMACICGPADTAHSAVNYVVGTAGPDRPLLHHFPAPPKRSACRMRPPPGTGCGPENLPSCAWPLARARAASTSCAASQFSRLPAHFCAPSHSAMWPTPREGAGARAASSTQTGCE